MNYGIPTLMEYPGLDGLAAFCAEQGFAFAELNMTFPWFQSGTLSARQLRETNEKYDVGFTVHLHDQVNPFEFSPEMRKGSLENIRFAMELARELGMPCLTMHLFLRQREKDVSVRAVPGPLSGAGPVFPGLCGGTPGRMRYGVLH